MWKNVETGETFANRKEAKNHMGHSNFNNALREHKIIYIHVYDACDIVI